MKSTSLPRMIWILLAVAIGAFAIYVFAGTKSQSIGEPIIDEVTGEQALEIVSLLPRDAIPSIDNPQFVGGKDAEAIYHPDELVLGVEIDGEARAYSIPFLSGHEIVNDEINGIPIAVTW